MCFYACILRSCGMLACEYNWVMTLFVSMLRDANMLVFSKVVEYLYMRIAEYCVNVWWHDFMLRYANILVIPQSCEKLVYEYILVMKSCIPLLKYAHKPVIPRSCGMLTYKYNWVSEFIYIYIRFHMYIQACVYIIRYKAF